MKLYSIYLVNLLILLVGQREFSEDVEELWVNGPVLPAAYAKATLSHAEHREPGT